jgi:Dinucleotide-utilizing enzymes involved in molybdopterin and thiamine biosynthesis family 2
MDSVDIRSVLLNCSFLETMAVCEGRNYKEQNYEITYRAKLIINKDKVVPIVICIPEKWYRDLIDIYVENYNEIDFMPHIDRKGKICLFDLEGVLIDQNLQGILIESLVRAKDILENGFLGTNAEDFLDEFELYWGQLPGHRFLKFDVPVSEVSQTIKCTFERTSQRKKEKQSEYFKRMYSAIIYAGKDSEILKKWNLKKTSIINAAYFIVSPDMDIFPPDIRKELSIEYLNNLLKWVSPKESSDILLKLHSSRVIIFAIRQPRGNTNFVGFYIEGGRIEIENDRYCIKDVSVLQPLEVHRADKNFLMMRTAQSDEDTNKKILVIGCGSIGGYLIWELVKNGFEDLMIVDDDLLSEENIFRHLLGMEYVSKYKCVAIEEYIRKNIPEVSIKSLAEKCEEAVLEGNIDLEEYDMVISATGNHNLNRWINSYIFNNKISVPVIYAWNEVYGIGNHIAYFKYGNEGCYDCLFGRADQTGELYDKSSYCKSGQKIVQSAGGCGKTYVPYGDTISLKTVLLCLDVIRKVFSGKLETNLLVSMKGDDSFFRTQGLETSGRFFRQKENIKILTGNQILNTECGVCGDN